MHFRCSDLLLLMKLFCGPKRMNEFIPRGPLHSLIHICIDLDNATLQESKSHAGGPSCPFSCMLVLWSAIVFSNLGHHSLVRGRLQQIILCILKLLGVYQEFEQERFFSISPGNFSNLPLVLRRRKVLWVEPRCWNEVSSEIIHPKPLIYSYGNRGTEERPRLPSLTAVTFRVEPFFSPFKTVSAASSLTLLLSPN